MGPQTNGEIYPLISGTSHDKVDLTRNQWGFIEIPWGQQLWGISWGYPPRAGTEICHLPMELTMDTPQLLEHWHFLLDQ